MDLLAIFTGIRGRLIELGSGLDERRSTLPVPGCPSWNVTEVYAHLVGGNADALAGRLDGMTQDWWTQRQVDERAGVPLPRLLDEWRALSPDFDTMLASLDRIPVELVLDAWTHEQDIRGALGIAGGPEPEVTARLAGMASHTLLTNAGRRELPPVQLTLGERTRTSGDGVVVSLTVDPHEYLRGAFGRRSRAQLRAWPWQGTDDPDPYIDALLIFGIASDDIWDADRPSPVA